MPLPALTTVAMDPVATAFSKHTMRFVGTKSCDQSASFMNRSGRSVRPRATFNMVEYQSDRRVLAFTDGMNMKSKLGSVKAYDALALSRRAENMGSMRDAQKYVFSSGMKMAGIHGTALIHERSILSSI